MIRVAAPNALSIARMRRPPYYDAGSGPTATLDGFLQYAIASSGGFTPLYFVDFQANQAIINGAQVGRVANIPSLTGTLNLGPSGHTVASNSNILVMPATGVTYPCTMVVQFTRTTGGADEYLVQLDSGSDLEVVVQMMTAGNVARLTTLTGGVSANAGSGSATTVGVRYKMASRVQVNNTQSARTPGTNGTAQTTAPLPAAPANIRVGGSVAGTAVFRGSIAKFAIIPVAATTAQLQGITLAP